MQNNNKLERMTPEEAGISSRQVQNCIRELMHENTQMHGFMAARYGKIFAECWWAPYHADLVHSNHSFGKSYTATAIGIAIMEKKLSLEERMTNLFAEEIKEARIEISPRMEEITIKDVLTMTNGHAQHPKMNADWIIEYFKVSMAHKPGTRFMYNSSGACMLAAVLKKKTGLNLKEYLTPRLFQKVGIDAERFVWLQWPNGIDAEPTTFATTEDNLRLTLLYLNGGAWNGEQIVDADFVKDALSVQIANDYAPEQKDGKCGYGYQLWACSISGVYRFDGGQGQYGIIWPEKELVISLHEGGMMPYGPQQTLDVLYDELLIQIQEGPLPKDEEAYAELLSYEKSMNVGTDQANRMNSAVDFNGIYCVTEGNANPWIGLAPPGGDDLFAIYRDPSKKADMTDFTLKILEQGCVLTVNGYAVFHAYLDGMWRIHHADTVFPGLGYYCATARFVKPYILEIRIHWMNSWTETKMRFEFQQEKMKITSMKIRLNEENNWLVYYGQAVKEEKAGV